MVQVPLDGVDSAGRIDDVSQVVASGRSAGLAEAQLSAFEDGSVTFEELDFLTSEAATCMENAGLIVILQGTNEQMGVPVPAYSFAAENLSDDELLVLADTCYLMYIGNATQFYLSEFGLSEDEEQAAIEASMISFAECLEAAGISDLPDYRNFVPEMVEPLLAYADDPRHNCTLSR